MPTSAKSGNFAQVKSVCSVKSQFALQDADALHLRTRALEQEQTPRDFETEDKAHTHKLKEKRCCTAIELRVRRSEVVFLAPEERGAPRERESISF